MNDTLTDLDIGRVVDDANGNREASGTDIPCIEISGAA
jgi:hypothetical protein